MLKVVRVAVWHVARAARRAVRGVDVGLARESMTRDLVEAMVRIAVSGVGRDGDDMEERKLGRAGD